MMNRLQFQGSFRINPNVYTSRLTHEKGAADFKNIEAIFQTFAPKIKALPDSIVLEYTGFRHAGPGTEQGIVDTASIQLMTQYDYPFQENSTLLVSRKPYVNNQGYNDKKQEYLDKQPDFYSKFIEAMVQRAEVLAKLFGAKSEDPYKLP